MAPILAIALIIALVTPIPAQARGGGSGHGSYHSSGGHVSTYCGACARDSHGRIARSETAKKEFETQTGHPNGWPGHVVDHIDPLKRGGADTPSNTQWQTKSEAKAKDKWE